VDVSEAVVFVLIIDGEMQRECADIWQRRECRVAGGERAFGADAHSTKERLTILVVSGFRDFLERITCLNASNLRAMNSDTTRRKFLASGSAAAASALAVGGAVAAAQEHEHEATETPAEKAHDQLAAEESLRTHPGPGGPVGSDTDRGKLVSGYRSAADPPVPVEVPDLEKMAWKVVGGVKEFHLTAEHVRREVLPDQWFDVWGYNGSMPGPMIEAVEGDRVRIVVHNNLPEATTVHWHGLELPIAMDGVPGLTQEPIAPGGIFTYEFDLHQTGTYFYHSHGAMQEVMGMTGLFVIHPKAAYQPTVDHDFGLIVQQFAILPQSTVPNSVSEDFNFFTINGRSGPYTTPLVVRLGSRVRIRFMNLSAMDHHPMHLHGHTFWVTGTEGGRIPEPAWIPTNNVVVGVGQSRDVEFIANNPGDWMIHCHILHHMMNHMVSMVGPMPQMTPTSNGGGEHRAIPATGGEELASGQLGAGLEPSLGPAVSADRPVMTGMRPSDMRAQMRVPGYPQDMMEMHGMLTPAQMKKVSTPLTRGMRQNWPMGSQAMMTVLRVLPDELYEKVVSGKGDVEPGESTPGAGSGEMMGHGGHDMHQMHEMPAEQQGHETHETPGEPQSGEAHERH
jgi:FtsP/CotA-like multicopper oxidase with cupredoxin domain